MPPNLNPSSNANHNCDRDLYRDPKELKADVDALVEELRSHGAQNDQILTDMEKMNSMETEANKADLARLKVG